MKKRLILRLNTIVVENPFRAIFRPKFVMYFYFRVGLSVLCQNYFYTFDVIFVVSRFEVISSARIFSGEEVIKRERLFRISAISFVAVSLRVQSDKEISFTTEVPSSS